jgi:hypothetical protein
MTDLTRAEHERLSAQHAAERRRLLASSKAYIVLLVWAILSAIWIAWSLLR